MGKVIIDNRSRLKDREAVEAVEYVMRDGRVSIENKQPSYCALTVFRDKEIIVDARVNVKSDRFIVLDQ